MLSRAFGGMVLKKKFTDVEMRIVSYSTGILLLSTTPIKTNGVYDLSEWDLWDEDLLG